MTISLAIPVALLGPVAMYVLSVSDHPVVQTLSILQPMVALALILRGVTRLSLVLPAAAVGDAVEGLLWSWNRTAPLSPEIFGFTVLTLLAAFAMAFGQIGERSWRTSC